MSPTEAIAVQLEHDGEPPEEPVDAAVPEFLHTVPDEPAPRRPRHDKAPAVSARDLIPDPLEGVIRVRAVWLVAAIVAVGWVLAAMQLATLHSDDLVLAQVTAERAQLEGGIGADARAEAARAADIEADMTQMRMAWDPGLAPLRKRLQQEAQDVACAAGTAGEDLREALAAYGSAPEAPPELADLPGWERNLNLASLESTWNFCRGIG